MNADDAPIPPPTDDELAAMARDLESDRVERKESLQGNAKGKIGEAICAFANDLPGHRKPGYILVGVADDGAPAAFRSPISSSKISAPSPATATSSRSRHSSSARESSTVSPSRWSRSTRPPIPR